MELLVTAWEIVIHLDAHLAEFVAEHGAWVYALLFVIVFIETGLVIWPFLPGDSLLFAAGALSATGALNLGWTAGLLAVAAFTGNAVNYAIGRAVGPRVLTLAGHSGISARLLNPEHVARAHAFFEQYGGKAVILGRFVPIVRTFVPFVAGAAAMSPGSFIFFNAVGAVAWVGLCVGAGVLFGNVPAVRDHFSLVTIGIVIVSVLPVAIELVRARRKSR